MTLQSSGAISLANIQTEFGGDGSPSLSEYYRGGGRVPNIAANAAIPTEGQISLFNFYGATVTIPRVALNISLSGTQYNAYVGLSSWPGYSSPGLMDITVTIESGAVMWSSAPATSFPAALTIEGAASGDVITVVNNGAITGRGGHGGWGDTLAPTTNGGDGGAALQINGAGQYYIVNNLFIGGGGGGGGGWFSTGLPLYGAGAGGGGAGGGDGGGIRRSDFNGGTISTAGGAGAAAWSLYGTNGTTFTTLANARQTINYGTGAGGGMVGPGGGGGQGYLATPSGNTVNAALGGGSGGGGAAGFRFFTVFNGGSSGANGGTDNAAGEYGASGRAISGYISVQYSGGGGGGWGAAGGTAVAGPSSGTTGGAGGAGGAAINCPTGTRAVLYNNYAVYGSINGNISY